MSKACEGAARSAKAGPPVAYIQKLRKPLSPMSAPVIYSIIESPAHPPLSGLYRRLGMEEIRLESQRKAISRLKKQPPDFIIAEFIYGFSTYYQATNISNLDVLLHSLVKYAPEARVIVLTKKDERELVDKLNAIHPLQAVVVQPATEEAVEEALKRNTPAVRSSPA